MYRIYYIIIYGDTVLIRLKLALILMLSLNLTRIHII